MSTKGTVTLVSLLLGCGAVLACSAEGRGIAPSQGPAPAEPGPSGNNATTPAINGVDGGSTAPRPAISEVYGHSGTDLYKLDPQTKAVTLIGSFSGCSKGVKDIALDEDSNIFGATTDALYRIDRQTAACTEIVVGQSGDFPNSLSFVPKGTVDANSEALVGYNDDVYVRIDPQTGDISVIGELGQGYKSSGDIVSVKGGGTYLTVTGQNCSDCLVEVDPTSGAMIRKLGSLGHEMVYGLAFWGGAAYGFDHSGQLFEVDLAAGKVSTKSIVIPKAPADLSFWGAGSSTSAPVDPVK